MNAEVHPVLSSPPAGEEAAAEAVGRRGGHHDAGLAVAIALTFLLALSTEWLALFFLAGRSNTFALTALVLMATPLLLAFIAIAISLARRPLWLRAGVAIFLLLVPPALLFSGAFHG